MPSDKRIKIYTWLNVCIVVPSLLIGGATMALLYLLVPWFFACVVAIYVFKFGLELWVWRKIPPQDRGEYRQPGHFMNFSDILSVKMEWILFWAGFLGPVLWIQFTQLANG